MSEVRRVRLRGPASGLVSPAQARGLVWWKALEVADRLGHPFWWQTGWAGELADRTVMV